MNQLINNRISALRALLKRENLEAFIVPETDPHLSEYVAPHWKFRTWMSGFTGSAGTLVVTLDKAGLWTDSRYFLQAARQLKDTCIDLYKDKLPETPSIQEFLLKNLRPDSEVGVDGKMFSFNEMEQMQAALSAKRLTVTTRFNPIGELWTDRPPMSQTPAFIHELKYAGVTAQKKIGSIRQEIIKRDSTAILLSALDEIAWTLNLRGNDVTHNPVIVSYLLITTDETIFFIDPAKVTGEVRLYLQNLQVKIHDYQTIESYLSSLQDYTFLVNPKKTNYQIYSSISLHCKITSGDSPVSLLKAMRNDQEIEGIHSAMQRDGIALVKFFKWLEETVPSEKETEISIDKKLSELRAEQPLYMGKSFDTIAGYKEHGAIVHYSATSETCSTLYPKGFLLLDSGAQYLDGTTDITRTIALGDLTEEEKTDYTLVLKGHIALACAKFPAGTRGAQLDVLARMPLWRYGMNYLHGTGHGVGHFLNVHEGPQNIRMDENPVALQPNMLISNEPGVYKDGDHGIRTENLVLVCKAGEGMYGDYLKFETMTLCPICLKGVIKEMLTTEEINWLNNYHKSVYEKLSPGLSAEECAWLREKTKVL
ncbi:Aminopeptidase YpdF [termite gut metagenome]|uniref:Aminopeptidase YpdF n=1 Tax=termite gut metagenome TaxID=433724 RepID=A0A5J4T1B4_9ZZZZ